MSKSLRDISLCLIFLLSPLFVPTHLFSQPDLVIDRARLISDLRTDVLDNNDACYINEGCVGGLGDRQLIRFTTHIKNIGDQDFVVGTPPSDPSLENAVWEYDLCHQHWHYEGYAQYHLFDQNGNTLPIGKKTGFCLMDSECSGGGTLQYHCGYQGISAGCGDIYGWSLDCQWIDVTDVPSGIYRLVNRVNYNNSPDLNGNAESNYNNNEASVCIQLSRSATGVHLFQVLPDSQCNCTDNDNDGVCANADCDDTNPSLPIAPGTACNDGDPLTLNDVIQADGCSCQGAIPSCTDLDNDGVCANADCDDNDASIPATTGTACNDGNILTVNDVIQADGCSCQGTIPSCTDVDNDGVCAIADCDDNDASVPTAPGTTCNDGNPNTTNDIIQADGCSCQGTPANTAGTTISCGEITVTYGNGQISMVGLPANSYYFKVHDLNNGWSEIFSCVSNCGSSQIAAVPTGFYKVKIYNISWVPICDTDINVNGSTGGCTDADNDGTCTNLDCNDNDPSVPAAPGTTCSDGDPNTTNDVILVDGCTCQGTIPNCTDADNDGTCANLDCNDNDPSVPTAPGTTCSDGDPNTTNDVILADGCTCQGTPVNTGGGTTISCGEITITYGSGQISMVGLPANSYYFKVHDLNNGWSEIFSCAANCGYSQVATVPTGFYKVKVYNISWVPICDTDINVNGSTGGGCTDIDNDGFCANADCDDNDASLPASPGATCNDGNPNTTNDIIQADGCTCQGTIPNCADVDNDGFCANVDCDDNDASLPATSGTACNDGDPNTTNDVIQADGCTCQGQNSGGNTGTCSDLSVSSAAGEITINGLTSPIEIVKLYRISGGWTQVDQCIANCGSQKTFTNLTTGDYIIEVQFYDATWGSVCSEQLTATVTSTLTDESGAFFRRGTSSDAAPFATKTFSLYPNPAKETFWLDLNNWESQTLEIIIFNHLSQPVLQQQIQHQKEEAQKILLPVISNGIYFVQVTNGAHTVTKKLSVAR